MGSVEVVWELGVSKWMVRLLVACLGATLIACSSVEVVVPNSLGHPPAEKYYISKIQWESGKGMKIQTGKMTRLGSADRVTQDDVDFAWTKVGDFFSTLRGLVSADLRQSPLMAPEPNSRIAAVLTIEPVRGYYGLDDETCDLTLIASLRVGGKSIWMEAIRVPSKKEGQLKAAKSFESKLISDMTSAGLF